MIENLSPLKQTVLGTLFTWGLTALGAGFVVVFNGKQRKLLDVSLGFAAGVMTAASFWSLLAPAIEMAEQSELYGKNGEFAFIPVAVGFFLGSLFVYMVDVFLADYDLTPATLHQESHRKFRSRKNSNDEGESYSHSATLEDNYSVSRRRRPNSGDSKIKITSPEADTKQWKRMLLLIIAITVHNVPEGLAVGVGFGAVGSSPSASFASARMESDLMEVERRERELLDQWRLLKEQKFRLYKEHEQSLEQLRSELRRKKTEVATLEEKLLEWENKLSKLSSSAEPEICSSVFPLREEAEIKVENVSNDQFDVDEIQNVLVTEEESVDEMYDDDVGSTSNSIDAGEESSHSSPNVLKKVSKKKKPKKSARVRRGCYKSVAVQLVDRSLRTLFKLILETLNVRNDAEMVVDGVRLDVLLPDVLSDFEDRDNERRLMKNSCMAYKVMEAFDECLFLAEKLGCFSKVSAEAKDAYMAIVREKRLTVSRIRGRRSIRRKNKYEIYQKACSLRKLL